MNIARRSRHLSCVLTMLLGAAEGHGGRLGVIMGGTGARPNTVSAMQDLGVTFVRANVNLDGNGPDLVKLLDAGFDLVITFANRDPWNVDTRYGDLDSWPNAGFPFPDPPDPGKARYQKDLQDALAPTLPYLALGRQIWVQAENEVGDASIVWTSRYWRGTTDQYLAQLEALYEAVRALDPDIPVVLSSFTSESLDAVRDPTDPNYAYATWHLTTLLGQGRYDAVDLHFYGCAEEIPAKASWVVSRLPTGARWISTENGGPDPRCPTTPLWWHQDPKAFEQDEAAQVQTRLQACLASGGSICLWFSLFDLMRETEVFAHLGLLDPSSIPAREKAAYAAYKAFVRPRIAAGEGAGPGNANTARLMNATGETRVEVTAYGAGTFGCEVATAELDGEEPEELVTGAGPGPTLGPQVRAFATTGASIAKINFYAYGTLRYGVRVSGAALDGDGMDEIVTGAGPGAPFGPQVRGFSYDNVAIAPIASVNYYAYGTLRYGVSVAAGSIDPGTTESLLTGPGPGVSFAPHVRGFAYDGRVTALARVSFDAFSSSGYGACVGAGDVDGDGSDEILASKGPGGTQDSDLRGFDVDGAPARQAPGLDTVAFSGSLYGARTAAAETTGDARQEIVAVPGPDPAYGATLRILLYDGQALSSGQSFVAFATSYGATAAGGGF